MVDRTVTGRSGQVLNLQVFVLPVEALTRLGFLWVAGVALVRWWRVRSRYLGALAVALSSLAFVLSFGWTMSLLGIETAWGDILNSAMFAVSGYAVFEHRAAIMPVDRRWKVLAASALAAWVIALAVTGLPPDGQQASTGQLVVTYGLLGTWLLVVAEPVVRLWRQASAVRVVRQTQLRLLSTGYAAIAVILLVVVTASQPTGAPLVTLIANILGLGVVGVLYLAAAPSPSVRRWWLRRHASRAASEAIPVATWYYDLVDDQLWWSEKLREILGVEDDRPATMERFRELLHPDDRDRMQQRVSKTLDEKSTGPGMDLRIVRPDGELRWVRGEGQVVTDPTGDPMAMFGIMHDVTTHKQAQQQLQSALDVERKLTQRLRRLDDMKSTFMSAVSHELRTPLTSIEGFATALANHRDQLSEEKVRMMFDRLLANTHRLEKLIGDLLDLDRLDRDVFELRLQETDLSRLVRNVVDQLPAGSNRVRLEVPEVAPIRVDPPVIERIVENLVVNAIRHGGQDTPVWVRLEDRADEAVLTVEDAGPGIPDEVKSSIFEPFSHGIAKPSQGAGIGLTIVSEFAELHGGEVTIEDRAGGGARFRVVLPKKLKATESTEQPTAA